MVTFREANSKVVLKRVTLLQLRFSQWPPECNDQTPPFYPPDMLCYSTVLATTMMVIPTSTLTREVQERVTVN